MEWLANKPTGLDLTSSSSLVVRVVSASWRAWKSVKTTWWFCRQPTSTVPRSTQDERRFRDRRLLHDTYKYET